MALALPRRPVSGRRGRWPSYVYDDFRVTLTPRADGGYDVRAVGADGVDHDGVFAVPVRRRRARAAGPRHRPIGPAAASARGPPTRDVGGGRAARELDAEHLGGALADALLAGDIAAGYDARPPARRAATAAVCASRCRSAAAPPLLSVPWELLYRRPRFFANQRQTPLVRHLDTGSAHRAAADRRRRSASSASSPARTTCRAARRRGRAARVEQAVAKVADARSGRARLARTGDTAPAARGAARRHLPRAALRRPQRLHGRGRRRAVPRGRRRRPRRGRRARELGQPAGRPGRRCASSCSTRARAPARR